MGLAGEEEAAERNLFAVYRRDRELPAALLAELSRPAVRADYWAEMQGYGFEGGCTGRRSGLWKSLLMMR